MAESESVHEIPSTEDNTNTRRISAREKVTALFAKLKRARERRQETPPPEMQPHDPEAKRRAENALNTLSIDTIRYGQTSEVVRTLTEAQATGADQLYEKLDELRAARCVGDTQEKDSAIDTVMLTLASKDQDELAKKLISSSPKERDRIDRAIYLSGIQFDQQEALQEKLITMHNEKAAAVRATLSRLGVNHEEYFNNTVDPDVLSDINPDFWPVFINLPEATRQKLLHSEDLIRTANIEVALDSYGLQGYTDTVFPLVDKITDAEQRDIYLASLRDTVALVEADDTIEADSKDAVVAKLSQFTSPTEALTAVRSIYGDSSSEKVDQFLWDIKAGYKKPDELIEINDGYTDTYTVYRSYIDRHPEGFEEINAQQAAMIFAKNASSQENARAHTAQVIALLESDESLTPSYYFLDRLSGYSEPASLVDSFGEIRTIFGDNSSQVREGIYSRRMNKGEETMDELRDAQVSLQRNGISFRSFEAGTVDKTDFFDKFLGLTQARGNEAQIDNLCNKWKISGNITEAYSRYLQPIMETGDYRQIDRTLRPSLEMLPAFQERFAQLGINPDQAQQIFASWNTFRSFNKVLTGHNEFDKLSDPNYKIPPNYVTEMVKLQTEKFTKHIDAISSYAEQYGNDELRTVIDTFGIYNFTKLTPERLHNQLERWNAGDIPAHTILVSARSDHNGALSEDGNNSLDKNPQTVPEEGFYLFEANDAVGLAKIAIKIGQHERAQGREPDILNFIVSAHGAPQGVWLGVNDERLDVMDYVAARVGQEQYGRRNNYHQHLGENYRLILQACSTGDKLAENYYADHIEILDREIDDPNTTAERRAQAIMLKAFIEANSDSLSGINIAESLALGHETESHGSSQLVKGTVVINTDGTVYFPTQNDTVPNETREIQSNIYSGR